MVGDTKPKRAVVVGFADGQAFFTFCQAANEQGIDCECDVVRRGESEPANADVAWTNGRSYGEEFTANRPGFSRTAPRLSTKSPMAPSTFFWLDDSDSGSELRQDLAAWEAKLSVNALVFFHGIRLERGDSPVAAWKEWAADRPHAIFSDGLGVGVVRAFGAKTRVVVPLQRHRGSRGGLQSRRRENRGGGLGDSCRDRPGSL